VLGSNLGSSPLPPGDPHTWSSHDDVEVHTENTDSWVVLDTEINVLLDTETEVSGGGEVSVYQQPPEVEGYEATARLEMGESGGRCKGMGVNGWIWV
jgi:hypothetical protein